VTRIEINRFTLVTLNLRFGLADDGENRWDLRKSVFPAMLGELDPDFLCVQEANDFQVEDVAALLAGHSYIGRRDPAPRFWQNNVIFYRKTWDCLENAHFFLSPTPTIPSRFRASRWPRQCTMGCFQKDSNQVVVVDTHFDFDPEIQRKSVGVILKHLATKAPPLPCVVAGDFNAPPPAPCIKAFVHGTADLAGGFKSVLSPPFTGTAHGFTGKTGGDPIDWILYRDGLVVETAGVIDKPYQGRYPSDHFPVLARFAFA
jgi:endonuclease/exonuclease/phosphatase family metal-dependent hydrolase